MTASEPMKSANKNRKGATLLLGAGILLCLAALAVLLSYSTYFRGLWRKPSDSYPEKSAKERSALHVDRRELAAGICMAKDALLRMLRPDGQFIYRIDAITGQEIEPGYNIVRHGGCIYAMVIYYHKYGDAEVRDAIIRASQFLVKNCVKQVGSDEEKLLAVVEVPESHRSHVSAGLGGTALGLEALLQAREIEPNCVDIETLRGLCRFICYMQNQNGSFNTKYFVETKLKDRATTSLYYPGEAILALTEFYKAYGDTKALESALLGMRYLAMSREGVDRVPADNWALVATERLLASGYRMEAADTKLFKEHALRVTSEEIATQTLNPAESPLYGCFTKDGRTTPTSTRLEGILDTLSYWPKEEKDICARLKKSADAGIKFLLRAQIKEGAQKGAFAETIEEEWNERPKRTSRPSPSEIRIDFIQHALSALLRYQEITEEKTK